MNKGSQNWIEHAARNDPEALFTLVAENPPPHILTYAAEALGDVPDGFRARAATVLLVLRDHPDPVVQEGVVLGARTLFRLWEYD